MSETVQATAVLAGASGVLIRGAAGTGKSLLVWQLIERGATLVADDRVHLSACHGRVIATALGATLGKIELRGRGIIAAPYERSAVIRLIVDIVNEDALERMPEDHEFFTMIMGVILPRQPVPARSGRAPMLVEAALRALSPHCNMGLRSAELWR
jgi:HPr kinase/phosphorylase